MKRLGLSLGSATLLLLTTQLVEGAPVRFQCFERSTRRPVAASLVDLSNAEVSCEPASLKPAATTTPEAANGPEPVAPPLDHHSRCFHLRVSQGNPRTELEHNGAPRSQICCLLPLTSLLSSAAATGSFNRPR